MLKLKLDPTFEAEVQVTIPGQSEPGTLPITFKYRPRDEHHKWIESIQERKDAKGKVVAAGKSFVEAFHDYAVGWGLPEEFTKENIDIFFQNYPAADKEIFTQYVKLLFGSRIKN